MYLFSFGDLMI